MAETWTSPPITVQWGDFFEPGIEDQKPFVEMVKAAFDSGFIDQRKAVEAIAPIFDIENVTEYLETLKKERDEKAKREVDQTGALAKATAAAKPQQPPPK